MVVDADAGKVSARNFIQGTVTNVARGAVNSDVTITAGKGMAVAAIITNSSVDRLGLSVGTPAAAMFKASSVIVSIEG
ncbi:Molybdenum transport protein ModE (fragment) (plasmid) [Cupriavidus taiwanensis]|uniref:Molybdenum transport protein ModE n=1 Tax=Cupriavidus taiwanensis TaxID=164546 RepID=A0A375IPJ8_9BURK